MLFQGEYVCMSEKDSVLFSTSGIHLSELYTCLERIENLYNAFLYEDAGLRKERERERAQKTALLLRYHH